MNKSFILIFQVLILLNNCSLFDVEPEAGAVQGYVHYLNNQGVDSVKVLRVHIVQQMVGHAGSWITDDRVFTDSTGYFIFKNLPPNRSYTFMLSWPENYEGIPISHTIEVTEGETIEIEFTLSEVN